MATLERRKSELEDIKTIGFISSAFVEISANRMQKLRDRIERSKRYYDEVSRVYAAVKHSARRRGDVPGEGGPSSKTRNVSVAFTSNKRFYGTLNRDVMHQFLQRTRSQKTDCIIIGSTGREIAEHVRESTRCQYHTFEKDDPTTEEMKAFLKRVEPYEHVFLYYPDFKSAFRQEVAELDITYAKPPVEQTEDIDYIFEPELPQILAFFEHQVRFVLFQRVMLETELARVGARFVTMTSIERHAEESKRQLTRAINQLRSADENRQLIEALTGFARWRAD